MEGMEAQATSATIEAVPDEVKKQSLPPELQKSKVDQVLDKVDPPKPRTFKIQLAGKKEGEIREEEITEEKIRKYLNIPPEEPWADNPYLEQAILKQYKTARDIEYKRNGIDREKIELANLINKMSTNFGQFLQEDLGMNPDEWALQRAQQIQQLQMMPPEQRQEMLRQQALEEKERYYADLERQLQEQQHQYETQEHFKRYTQGVGKAIQKLGIPQDSTLLAIAADHLEAQARMGVPMTFEEAAAWTINKFKNVNKTVLSQLKGDQLLNYLGDDLVREIQKSLNAKNTKPAPQVQGKVDIAYKPQTPQDTKMMSRDEYEAYLEQRKRQLDGR